jgi:hypothetical protein
VLLSPACASMDMYRNYAHRAEAFRRRRARASKGRPPDVATLDAPRRLPSEIDLALLWSTLILLVIGMVMVYSASMATAEAGRQTGNQPAYFLVRHAVFLIIGLVAAGGFPGAAVDLAALVAVAVSSPVSCCWRWC